METQYYIAQIDERNGEYIYSHTILLQCKDGVSAQASLNDIARFWYNTEEGGCDDFDNETDWYSNGGEVCTCAGNFDEITLPLYLSFKATKLFTEFERTPDTCNTPAVIGTKFTG